MNGATFRNAGPALHALGWRPFPADSRCEDAAHHRMEPAVQPEGGMTGEELDELDRACGDDACSIAVRPDLLVVDPMWRERQTRLPGSRRWPT